MMNDKHTKKYQKGYIEAIQEFDKNKFNVDDAIYDYMIEPPKNQFEQGYLDALLSIKRHGVPTYQVDNVVYVGFGR